MLAYNEIDYESYFGERKPDDNRWQSAFKTVLQEVRSGEVDGIDGRLGIKKHPLSRRKHVFYTPGDLQADFGAEFYSSILKYPSVSTYTGLMSQVRNCSEEWMQEFLDFGGVSLLFDSLTMLSDRSIFRFTDALLLLECVHCIKAVMRSNTGLEYMVNHPEISMNLIVGESFV